MTCVTYASAARRERALIVYTDTEIQTLRLTLKTLRERREQDAAEKVQRIVCAIRMPGSAEACLQRVRAALRDD